MATIPNFIAAHSSGPKDPPSEENLAPLLPPEKQHWFNGKPRDAPVEVAENPINAHGNAIELDVYRGTVVYRVSTTRIPADDSAIKLERLAQMLDKELNGTREWDVGSLISDIYTDEALGITKVRKSTHTTHFGPHPRSIIDWSKDDRLLTGGWLFERRQ